MRTSEQSRTGLYFFLIVILFYAVVGIFNFEAVVSSLYFFKNILIKIIPILLFIFCLMFVINYFTKPDTLVKYLGKDSGILGYFYATITGIISTGPIYMWYPLLNELQKHKVKNGLIATFLYNRAIKPALLPLFIYYFGLAYAVVLTIVMVFVSMLQGWTVEKLMEVEE